MRKILVVDDDRDLSDTIKSVLEYDGFEVQIANDPQNGINIAKENNPDLILMDIMLPGMNGAEAVKLLKSDDAIKDIPIIFLTGLVANTEDGDGLKVEGVNYQTLAKPFKNEKLLEAVKDAIG